jgi:hypothetical protein
MRRAVREGGMRAERGAGLAESTDEPPANQRDICGKDRKLYTASLLQGEPQHDLAGDLLEDRS